GASSQGPSVSPSRTPFSVDGESDVPSDGPHALTATNSIVLPSPPVTVMSDGESGSTANRRAAGFGNFAAPPLSGAGAPAVGSAAPRRTGPIPAPSMTHCAGSVASMGAGGGGGAAGAGGGARAGGPGAVGGGGGGSGRRGRRGGRRRRRRGRPSDGLGRRCRRRRLR